jgi:hypothetical protein
VCLGNIGASVHVLAVRVIEGQQANERVLVLRVLLTVRNGAGRSWHDSKQEQSHNDDKQIASSRRPPFGHHPYPDCAGTHGQTLQTKPSPVRYGAKDLEGGATEQVEHDSQRRRSWPAPPAERRRNPPPFLRFVDWSARRSGSTKRTQVDRAPRSRCEPARAVAAAPPPPLGPRSAAVAPR